MTFSRLTLGEPRLKSNLRGGSVETADPCNEPTSLGTNVLTDPGAENHITQSGGGGPGGDEVPEIVSYEWSDGSTAPFTYWMADFNIVSPARRWKISTSNPLAGTYHFRWEGTTGVNNSHGAPGDALYAVEFEWCDNPTFTWAWTMEVQPGNVVDVSCSSMTNSTAGNPHVWTGLLLYDSTGSAVADYSDHFVLTTSYVANGVSGTAPSGAKYVQAYYGISSDDFNNLSPSLTVDIDSTVVGIAE